MTAPAPPTARQIEGLLKLLLKDLMVVFHANNIDGLTINSLGTILAGIKFGGEQTAVEVEKLIQAVAVKQEEEIKIHFLRASVVN